MAEYRPHSKPPYWAREDVREECLLAEFEDLALEELEDDGGGYLSEAAAECRDHDDCSTCPLRGHPFMG